MNLGHALAHHPLRDAKVWCVRCTQTMGHGPSVMWANEHGGYIIGGRANEYSLAAAVHNYHRVIMHHHDSVDLIRYHYENGTPIILCNQLAIKHPLYNAPEPLERLKRIRAVYPSYADPAALHSAQQHADAAGPYSYDGDTFGF